MDEKRKKQLEYLLKILPDSISLYLEQYKAFITPLAVLIATNSGLAYFAHNINTVISRFFLLMTFFFLLMLISGLLIIQGLIKSVIKMRHISERPRDLEKEYIVTNQEFGWILKENERNPKEFKRFINYFYALAVFNLLFILIFFVLLTI